MRQAKAMLRDIFNTSDLFSTPKTCRTHSTHAAVDWRPGRTRYRFLRWIRHNRPCRLEMNQQDGGNLRFILVSSTEATEAEPDKNICRDICAERVRRVIRATQTRKMSRSKDCRGLSRIKRTRQSPEKVFSKIQHEQVWTAIQLIHSGSVSDYVKKETVQKASTERGIVLYVPIISKALSNDC